MDKNYSINQIKEQIISYLDKNRYARLTTITKKLKLPENPTSKAIRELEEERKINISGKLILLYGQSTADELANHNMKWHGNDLEKCINKVYSTRGKAK